MNQNFSLLTFYSSKVDTIPDIQNDNESLIVTKIYQALGEISSQNFRKAADIFTGISFSSLKGRILHPCDVARLGLYCAFSSYERCEILALLDKENFREYLDADPESREILTMFRKGQFALCLNHFQNKKSALINDCYLRVQVDSMVERIAEFFLIKYIQPYSSVLFRNISDNFSIPLDTVEEKILHLIRKEKLSGRIDGIDKIFIAVEKNYRNDCIELMNRLGEKF